MYSDLLTDATKLSYKIYAKRTPELYLTFVLFNT